MAKKEITIAGAGLVGSLLSILLAKEGYSVKVYEKRPNPLTTEPESGRSINLALSHRGIKALEMAGVAEKVMPMTIPMKGRMLHDHEGNLKLVPYGEEGQQINSVSRSGLTSLLIEEALSLGVEFSFNMRCDTIDPSANTIHFTNTITNQVKETGFELLIGADGAFSAVRGMMQKTDRFNYSQNYLEHGYKELHIAPGTNNDHRLFKNALHIWPREKFMLIALPNPDGSFTVTLFLAFEGSPSFSELKTKDDVTGFFEKSFPDALKLIPDLAEQFFSNPTSSLVTVHCYPWVYDSKIALIGDAAHAIVPFYGQGMNAGFEDCRVLVEIIRENKEKGWETILNKYQKARKENADAIAELAIRNFVEMRDLVADERFQLRKKIESRIHQKYPDYLPLYSMVTFSDFSYKEALEKGKQHDLLMEKLMNMKGVESFWETEALWEKLETIKEGSF